ncbi:MAG: site-specific integrase, partial [Desulfobacteraceae bacterium]|nr:site-specific integrase [Desulfobacteraceae bacterium]
EYGRKLSNRHLRDLKALYNWAARSDYLDANPLKHIQPKGEDKQPKYVPPPSDVKAVLLAASQEEMDIILAVYATGARISEIRRLTWDDVNLENNSITLWTRKRKGGGLEADTVNMTLKLQDVMKRRWKARNKNVPYVFHREDGTRYTRDTHFMKKFMPRLCERAGVKPFGFHGIRHLVARILADSGKANLREIQHFLRHHRATTTDTYLKELQPGSKVAAGILDGFDIDDQGKETEGKDS